MELVANLRQMGDSLRSNAERLLRDVQGVHTHMMTRIEHLESSRRASAAPQRARDPRRRSGRAGAGTGGADDSPDVPEFIPRR
jgi:hypothetical protein